MKIITHMFGGAAKAAPKTGIQGLLNTPLGIKFAEGVMATAGAMTVALAIPAVQKGVEVAAKGVTKIKPLVIQGVILLKAKKAARSKHQVVPNGEDDLE